jgi:hypothetical protein
MANPIQSNTPTDAVALTKSDTTTYADGNGGMFDGLYVGGAGDVAVRTAKGSTVTFSGATAGSTIPIRFDRLMSTNTTATLVLGLRF